MPERPAEPPEPANNPFAELLKGFFNEVPNPEECPQCGSIDFVPIVYGLLTEEGEQRARDGEFAMGGCCFEPQRWLCRSCGHRWPDEWPPLRDLGPLPSEEERRAEKIQKSLKEYARFTDLAKQPPKEPEAFVDRVLRRPGYPEGRSFGVRFSWGRVVVEKTTDLVDEGGAPEFSCGGPGSHGAPAGWDTEAEAITVVLRHVERYGDAPYTAIPERISHGKLGPR